MLRVLRAGGIAAVDHVAGRRGAAATQGDQHPFSGDEISQLLRDDVGQSVRIAVEPPLHSDAGVASVRFLGEEQGHLEIQDTFLVPEGPRGGRTM